MTDLELHQHAFNLAEMTLANEFNIDAYILKILSAKELAALGHVPDYAPDSNVDECINNLLKIFIAYNRNKNINNLDEFMNTIKSIISEIYHNSETLEERNLIQNYIKKISMIK